jgi:holo-[acyl-carrier protein] synthase
MIYGIGTDIVQIERIATAAQSGGERFAEKILGTDEMAIYRSRAALNDARGISFLATRFAAKEAFSKALGTGMRAPISWHAIQVLNSENGAPQIVTSGELYQFLENQQLRASISLSDEAEYGVAFVIIEQSDLATN